MKQLLLSVYDCCHKQSSLVIEDGKYVSECKNDDFTWDDVCFLCVKKEERESYYNENAEERVKKHLPKFADYDEIILCEDGEIRIIKREELF